MENTQHARNQQARNLFRNKIIFIIAAAVLVLILISAPTLFKNFINPQASTNTMNMTKEEMQNMKMSDMPMVLSYTQISGNSSSYLLRVAIPKNFGKRPTMLQLLGQDGKTIKDIPLTLSKKEYICMNAEDGEHNMPGFETGLFKVGGWTPTSGRVNVFYTDSTNTQSTVEYKLSDICTRFLDTNKGADAPGKDSGNLPPE